MVVIATVGWEKGGEEGRGQVDKGYGGDHFGDHPVLEATRGTEGDSASRWTPWRVDDLPMEVASVLLSETPALGRREFWSLLVLLDARASARGVAEEERRRVGGARSLRRGC